MDEEYFGTLCLFILQGLEVQRKSCRHQVTFQERRQAINILAEHLPFATLFCAP